MPVRLKAQQEGKTIFDVTCSISRVIRTSRGVVAAPASPPAIAPSMESSKGLGAHLCHAYIVPSRSTHLRLPSLFDAAEYSSLNLAYEPNLRPIWSEPEDSLENACSLDDVEGNVAHQESQIPSIHSSPTSRPQHACVCSEAQRRDTSSLRRNRISNTKHVAALNLGLNDFARNTDNRRHWSKAKV